MRLTCTSGESLPKSWPRGVNGEGGVSEELFEKQDVKSIALGLVAGDGL
jgi:hypothetical protein